MRLDDDTTKLKKVLSETNTSANIDRPEGGLDALIQAIVCKNIIDWVDNRRRIVVFFTDSDFHVAGDGKLGGIVLPNDLKCHMENDTYTMDTVLDYPSIGQLVKVVKENSINLLFIVTDDTKEEKIFKRYEYLSKKFSTARAVNTKYKGNSLTNIIKEYYMVSSLKAIFF